MSEDSNVCAVCGGLKGPVTREFLDHLLCSAPYTNPLFFRACSCHPEPAEKHDGDLGHNTTAFYSDEKYITDNGESFFNREVCLSDKMRHICLIPKEALSLLAWLTQERGELQRLAKEQGQ